MPSLNGIRLPPPKSWEEFEEMCKSSFSLRWHNPNLSMHGRQGQKQDGVDIYGTDSLHNFVGIQCKNTTSTISKGIIDDECCKAERFLPAIQTLYIATTAPRDIMLQAYVRNLSAERIRQSKFPIDIVFWDDITQDLTKDAGVVRQYYPDLFGQSKPTADQLIYEKDQSNLINLLDVIDFYLADQHLDGDAKYIHYSLIAQFENIQRIIHSPVFQLFDHDLSTAVYSLVEVWGELAKLVMIAPYRFIPQMNTFSFILPGDAARNNEENDLYYKICDQVNALKIEIHHFCHFINSNYHHINLQQTCQNARKYY